MSLSLLPSRIVASAGAALLLGVVWSLALGADLLAPLPLLAAALTAAGVAGLTFAAAGRSLLLHNPTQQSLLQVIDALPWPLLLLEKARIVHANPAAHTFLGVNTTGMLAGHDLLAFIVPEDQPQVEAWLNQAAKSPRPPTLHARVTSSPSAQCQVRLQGAQVVFGGPAFFEVMITDRTEEHHAQAEAERLASFPLFNPDPIVEVQQDGTIRFVNIAVREAMRELEAQGTAHPFLANLEAYRVALYAGRRRAEGQVVVRETRYDQVAVFSPNSDTVRIYGRDVTEREQAAYELARSEDKFARVFRLSPVGLSLSRLSDGCLLDVNERFVEMLGYNTPDEVIGRSTVELGLWDNLETRGRVAEMLQQYGRMKPRLGTIRTRTGAIRHVTGSAEVIRVDGEACISGMIIDVEEQEQLRRRVEEERDFARSVIDTLGQGLLISDRTYQIQYVNEVLLQMTGYTREEVVGREPADFLDPRDRALVLADRDGQRRVQQGGLYDARIQRKDGSYLEALVAAMPRTEGTELAGTTVVVIDITDRKRIEAEVIQARDEAEKLSALKSSFIANMSHEVRTPLTAVIGFAEVLQDEIEVPALRELAVLIKESGVRLLETLNSVLDLARLEANAIDLALRPADLGPPTRMTIELFRRLAEQKGLTLVADIPDAPMLAQVDVPAYNRIMNNLVSNAVKFTSTGTISVSLRRADAEVVVEVADTGEGISSEFLDFVFKEFRQESLGLARTHQGSGLGLAIARRLVEMMHGTIEVVSTKGEGARFTVTLPAAGDADA